MENSSPFSRVVGTVVSLVILAVGVGGFYLLVRKERTEASAPAENLPPLVQTVTTESHGGTLDICVDGIVTPFREIELAAEVAGRIANKSDGCLAGHYVTRGTLLLEIDPRDYELDVRRLTSQFHQAEASLSELEVEISNTEALIELAEEDLTLQRKELKRLQDLSGGRVVTQSELDRARQAEVGARNSLLTPRNQLELLKARRNRLENARDLVAAELEQANLDLERTKIMAPVDGVVVHDSVEQGDYVQKGAALVAIEDTSAVEVRCNLRMEDLYWLWRRAAAGDLPDSDGAPQVGYQIPQTPVTVAYQLAGRTDVRYTWPGKLSRYEGIGLDEKTRTVPCRVRVENPRDVQIHAETDGQTTVAGPPALVRGMYVTVEIHVQPPVTLVRIPEKGVRPGKSVWLLRNGRLEILRSVRPVALIDAGIGQSQPEKYWLVDADASNLAAGDKVVISPIVAATPGMPLREQDGT